MDLYQKRLVRVVCEGLRHSCTSMGPPPSTEVTVGMVGLVRSVSVVGVLDGGLMEPLEMSETGPDGVPPAITEPSDALSPLPLSWRSRFRRNLALAFWNHTWAEHNERRVKRQRTTRPVHWLKDLITRTLPVGAIHSA